VIVEAHGLRVELPAGWSGRIFGRRGGIAALHAGSFPVVLDDGEFGDRTTGRMPRDGAFLALAEYLPGRGLHPGRGLFAPRRIPRRLDPTSLSARGLAHPRHGQAGVQHFFTAAGRPFCLYVVIAGRRHERRRQLLVVERVLATLRIGARQGWEVAVWPS
jgi:hypothetical protein